jgi:hypothetical protein
MSIRKNIKILHKFFKKDDWRYEFDEEDCCFKCGASLENSVGNVRVFLNVTDGHVASMFILPQSAPEGSRAAVAELACRINYKLAFGQFDMDFSDGELRFRYVMPSEELADDPMEKARRLLHLPYAAMKLYGAAFVKVMLGARTPEEALKEAESGTGGDDETTAGEGASGTPAPSSASVEDGGESMASRREGQPEYKKPEKRGKEETPRDSDAPPVPVRDYTLDGLSIRGDLPLAKVVTAVKNFRRLQSADGAAEIPDRPRMSLLLWGPPGTGKTEFVNYLGQQLGNRVVVKMASDFLDHWVGKTEKSIRAAFEEAEEEDAILFLDELDGLMQDRTEATANWEVTLVNELLDCMERFRGVMVGATNFKDHLDAAVLRRFTYKLEFGYLERTGKHIFFDRAFKTPLTEKDAARLDAISNLTPGDFKTVSQKLYYLGEEVGNAERLSALEEESSLKKELRRVCHGFTAA